MLVSFAWLLGLTVVFTGCSQLLMSVPILWIHSLSNLIHFQSNHPNSVRFICCRNRGFLDPACLAVQGCVGSQLMYRGCQMQVQGFGLTRTRPDILQSSILQSTSLKILDVCQHPPLSLTIGPGQLTDNLKVRK